MNTEELMRVYVVDSRYEDDTSNLVITDVPPVPFINSRNPLYVGVRQGQIKRMKNNIQNEKLGGTSLGYWELTSYVSRKGKINLDEFKKHDVIFFASPDRCHEKHKEIYSKFIDTISTLLQ